MNRGVKSVLLVEDSTLVRFSSKRLLENNGYEVEEAKSGEEALTKIKVRPDPFDLVVIDIHLPGIDGLAVLEELKDSPQYQYIPVMMLTSDTKLSTVKRAIQMGAVEFLCKPFTNEQLLQRVEKLIGRSEKTPREVLEELLRLEINRAARGNTKFSLVLAQRKGSGKFSIADVERYLRKRLREIDEVVVLDDNVIAMVLPLTDSQGASVVIKKFKEWLNEKEWSFGVAVYLENGKDSKELLECAQTKQLKENTNGQ